MTSTKQEPAGRLFDVTGVQPRTFEGQIEKVPLDELELAVNPRRYVSAEGIDRLAVMLSRGQLVPAIGRRVAPGWVLLYAGQRRLLAAKRTHDLAGTNGFESINRVACLIVLMLDYEPTEADIRRVRSEISGSRPDVRAADQEQAEDHSRESTLRPPDLDDWQVMPGYAGDPMDFDGPLSLDVTLRGGAAEHKDVDNTARDIVRAFNHVFGHTNAEVAAYRVCRQSLGPPRVHARVMPAARLEVLSRSIREARSYIRQQQPERLRGAS